MNSTETLGTLLREKKLTISVAESCTGGLISKLITDVAGSSDYFDSGHVTYSNQAKMSMLDVPKDVLDQYGAVSSQCAEAMVRGVKARSGSDICVAVTGIAGPSGGTQEKPVGLVYAGFWIKGAVTVEKLFFKGDRNSIRLQTAEFCLEYLIKRI